MPKMSLYPAGTPTAADEHVVNQAGTTRKITAQGVADLKTWANLAGKPSTFPPEAHAHAQSDVTNLVTDLAGKEPTQTAVSQADAEAGTGTVVRSWTPQRVAQAIAALAPGGGGELENIVRLGSDVSNSTTTLADITGLAFAMEADKDYLVEAFLFQSAAATTTGIRQALNGPASPTRVAGEWTGWGANANAPLTRGFNAYEQANTAATDTPSTIGAVKLMAIVRNGANAGNLQLRFASEVGGSAVTILTGSLLRWRKLN